MVPAGPAALVEARQCGDRYGVDSDWLKMVDGQVVLSCSNLGQFHITQHGDDDTPRF